MRFYGAFTNKKRGADLFVALSLSHQFEHVDLTRAQCFAADTLCQLGREMHGNTRFARVHPTDAIHQRLARHIFEQITFRAGLNGAVDIFITVERCQHNDPRFLIAATDFLKRANAIELRHTEIEQRHIGTMLLPKNNCFAPIARLADDGHVCFPSNERNQAFADNAVIISDEDSDTRFFRFVFR